MIIYTLCLDQRVVDALVDLDSLTRAARVPRKIEGLPAHLILSYPGRSGEVQPCLKLAEAKLT
jgi:hypothetical protein